MLRFLRKFFPRPVRVTIYTGSAGIVAAEVAAGNLPGWAAAFIAPALLSLLHLTPTDVAGQSDLSAPPQD